MYAAVGDIVGGAARCTGNGGQVVRPEVEERHGDADAQVGVYGRRRRYR